jgi:hypothetical protein
VRRRHTQRYEAHAQMSTTCDGVSFKVNLIQTVGFLSQRQISRPANPASAPGEELGFHFVLDVMSGPEWACYRRGVDSPLTTGARNHTPPKKHATGGCPAKIMNPVISKRMLTGVT